MSRRSGAASHLPPLWWQTFPYCWYCRRPVRKRGPTDGNCLPDEGTVEHIPPLWIARMSGEVPVKVLACRACNEAEGRRVQQMFPQYFLHLWTGATMPRQRKMLMPGIDTETEALDSA